ncbi:MAG: hypothetical protein J6R18_00695, partial [Kiritimatiellae bacterium]|nr:hypothetical protein [Kiritimatiellia bacterium]
GDTEVGMAFRRVRPPIALGNREPSTADRCAERIPTVGRNPENTSRPALCGASLWGGLAVRQYFRVAANHMPPQVLREGF